MNSQKTYVKQWTKFSFSLEIRKEKIMLNAELIEKSEAMLS